jgi:Zn-dependent protease with chaperone function
VRFRAHQDDARSATRRLLVLFALVLLGVVVAVNAVLYVFWWAFASWVSPFPPYFFESNTALVLLFVLGGCLVETSRLRQGGGEHVAQWAGGREVLDPRDAQERRLLNVVDEMTIASGLPRPRVYVLDREEAINAFACGWTPEDAVVAVTRGALDRLTRDELQGLVAHEFGHIQQDDLRLNMVLLALVWGLSLVHGYGKSRMAADEDGNRSAFGLLIGAGFVVAGSVGWLAGQILQAAVSRQRELLADACAVQFTRSREGLGGTLRKVWFQAQEREDRLVGVPAQVMAAMLLQAPAGWMATHPSLPTRLRRIYGRGVEPLPAPLLRLQPDDEPRVLPTRPSASSALPNGMPLAYAAAMSPSPTPLDPSVPAFTPVPAAPEASASVPLARPVPTEAEREAIDRLSRLNGSGELRAAILALLMTPNSQRERRAWRDETRGLGTAKNVCAEVDKLGPAARLPWLELLLQRAANAPMSDRQALVEAARRVMAADGQVRPIDRLHWLAMRRRLAPPPSMQPAIDAQNDLALLPEALRDQVARLTAFLSRVVPGGDGDAAGDGWYRAVARYWTPSGNPTACDPPDTDGLVHAVAEVQTLPWMLRPVLVRAWLEAALALSPLGRLDDTAADALRLAGFLLDSPMPPELARHYIDAPAA